MFLPSENATVAEFTQLNSGVRDAIIHRVQYKRAITLIELTSRIFTHRVCVFQPRIFMEKSTIQVYTIIKEKSFRIPFHTACKQRLYSTAKEQKVD
jgi:hypothetical protein